jgi:uncharacterized membrane protein
VLVTSLTHESVEILYPYDRDYVFNGNKFEMRFSFSLTSYTEGIRQVVQQDYTRYKKGL